MISNAISISSIFQLLFRISTVVAQHDYWVPPPATTDWYDANQYCLQSTFESLAVIENVADETALTTAIGAAPPVWAIPAGTPFWVGLYRQASGDFAWADGTSCAIAGGLCVTGWVMPINPASDCVTLTISGGGIFQYEAVSCTANYRYVCSWRTGITPGPTIPDVDPGDAIGTCGTDRYVILGVPCTASGDPHFMTWSGVNHDYQGNPQVNYDLFYYVAPCFDANAIDLPFTIIGKHYYWDPVLLAFGQATTLEYLVFELFKSSYGPLTKYDKYYLWISSDIQAYIDANNITPLTERDNALYDQHVGNPFMVNIPAGSYHTIGGVGGRFEIQYTMSGTTITVDLRIDGVDEVHFTMYPQWSAISGYYRAHYLQLNVPTNYRCYICGLCGDFKRAASATPPQTLITCKGGLVNIQAGWTAGNAFAYDLYGNTWSYEYFNDECPLHNRPLPTSPPTMSPTPAPARRRLLAEDLEYIPEGGPLFKFVDPCDYNIKERVIATCQAARNAAADYCKIVGVALCDKLQADCEFDACAAAGGNVQLINRNVREAFWDPLRFVANISGVQDLFHPDNLVTISDYTYVPPDEDPFADILAMTTANPTMDPTFDPCDCYQLTLLSETVSGSGDTCYRYQVGFCDDGVNSVTIFDGGAANICGARIGELITSLQPPSLSYSVDNTRRIQITGLSNGDSFRICFTNDAGYTVSGTVLDGTIRYETDGEEYSCSVMNVLPNVCGSNTPAPTRRRRKGPAAKNVGIKTDFTESAMNTIEEQPESGLLARYIWCGVIASITSIMVVSVCYIALIKPQTKTQVYSKGILNENNSI